MASSHPTAGPGRGPLGAPRCSASLRREITPSSGRQAGDVPRPGFPSLPVDTHTTPSADRAEAPPAAAPVRLSWARLLKRMFEIDLEHCPPLRTEEDLADSGPGGRA